MENSREVESQILRVHLGCKSVGDSLGLSGRDLKGVLLSRKVAHDGWRTRSTRDTDRGQQRAPDELQLQWLGFIVLDRQETLRGVAIYKLDTEELCIGERRRQLDGEIG